MNHNSHNDLRVVTTFNDCLVEATFKTYGGGWDRDIGEFQVPSLFFKHYTNDEAAVFIRENGDHSWRLIPVRKLPSHCINDLIDRAEWDLRIDYETRA